MERLPKHYNVLSTIAEFKKYKLYLSNIDSKIVLTRDSKIYLTKLLSLPASMASQFSDAEWDFNSENPNVSASISGTKLKINFSKYKNISTGIIIEIKCLLLSILLSPEVFINNRRKAKKSQLLGLLPVQSWPMLSLGLDF